MLADDLPRTVSLGSIARTIREGLGYYGQLLDFIQQQLPRWRDDPERATEEGETRLTHQLCTHLNSAARMSAAWDHLQFRTEVGDAVARGRALDLTAQPSGAIVWIDGRQHTIYDPIIPIECKRLPTPTEHERDEREYVFSRYGTRGGIQRFKIGAHGANFTLAAMIGYIQGGTVDQWIQRTAEWIRDLAQSDGTWQESECLALTRRDGDGRGCRLHSAHCRSNSLPPLTLVHLWIEMR